MNVSHESETCNMSMKGCPWSDHEEKILLEELNNNVDIKIIAQKHGRTICAINSRRREIAYKMYLKNVSIEEIIRQTKFDNTYIKELINKRQNNNSKKDKKSNLYKKHNVSININKDDYIKLQNDIKEIKNTLEELVEMTKALISNPDVIKK